MEASLKEMTFGGVAGRKPISLPPIRESQTKRRLECDETVFRIYKGVRTFDFCKEKNVIATGGKFFCLTERATHVRLTHVTNFFYRLGLNGAVLMRINGRFCIENETSYDKCPELHAIVVLKSQLCDYLKSVRLCICGIY